MKTLKDFIELHQRNIIPLDDFDKFSISEDIITLPLGNFPQGDYKLIPFRHGFISITNEEPSKISNIKRKQDFESRFNYFAELERNEKQGTYEQIFDNLPFMNIPENGNLHLITTPGTFRLNDVLMEHNLNPIGSIYVSKFISENKRLYVVNTGVKK